MSTGKGLIAADQMKQVIALDKAIRETNAAVIEAERSGNEVMKAITMANGMKVLREGLTPLMGAVMELMGTPMGFRTDKDRPRYEKDKKDWDRSTYKTEEVRDVLIVGLMRGFRVVGNEINIIAGNFYATKEGMRRFVMQFPGLTNFRIQFGVPEPRGESGSLVPAIVTWQLHGKPDQLDCRLSKRGDVVDDMRIPIRVNAGMGVDAIHGKAESKIYRRVYMILTGSEVAVDDDENTIDSTATVNDEPQSQELPESGARDESEILLDEFFAGLLAAETPVEARKLYDAWFGPDSTREWSPEQNQIAAQRTKEREDVLRSTRGPSSNKAKQKELEAAR